MYNFIVWGVACSTSPSTPCSYSVIEIGILLSQCKTKIKAQTLCRVINREMIQYIILVTVLNGPKSY